MEAYALMKEQLLAGEKVSPSVSAMQVAFDLNLLDIVNDFLEQPNVQQELEFRLDEISSRPNLIAFLATKYPHSEIYQMIKKEYLSIQEVWQVVVEIENIPLTIEGIYTTGDNQAVVKQNQLKEIDIILENKDHPIVSSLNLLQEKKQFNFKASLQIGSLFTYQGQINLEDYDQDIQNIKTQEQNQLKTHNQFKKIIKGFTGTALALGMSLAITGCGKNPNEEEVGYYEIPMNNSPDCMIRKAHFYDKLGDLKSGMSEEEVDLILDPHRRLRKGSFKYSTSYEIEGFDYSVPGVVTCEAVQIHFDSNWRFRLFQIKTYPL